MSEAVVALFEARFGRPPVSVASAPGRVNLIGEHTDYNGGEVLPIAIERRTFVAVGPAQGSVSRAVSATAGESGAFATERPERAGQWWDYVAGTVREFHHVTDVPARAVDVAVCSDVPAGAGLSSSAALEVAVGTALAGLYDTHLGPDGIARLSHDAENEFVGVASGIMDQYASALAAERHALHLWCDPVTYEHVPMGATVLIFDTAVPRSLRSSAFNTRRRECEAALARLRAIDPGLTNLAAASLDLVAEAALPEPLGRRARHVVTEVGRVDAAVRALASGAPIPGDVMLASHASLRDDYECSSAELDWFVERIMLEGAVVGARLTGAGWGGCAIAVGAPGALAAAAPAVAADFRQRFGWEPRAWVTAAAAGARLEPASRP